MRTSETPLAAYLIQSGFALLEIQYEIKPDGKRQGFFVFDDEAELQKCIEQFNVGKSLINLVLYERTRADLIDRVMRGRL